MAAPDRSTKIARVVGSLALLTGALAIGAPVSAAGPKATATAAKPKAKPRATAAKKTTVQPASKRTAAVAPSRSITLKKGGVATAQDVGGDLSFIPGSTYLPFADMPKPPHAEAQGVTPDSFPVTPWQLETPHGAAAFAGTVMTRGANWGFRLPSRFGTFAIYPNASWMAGHDLSLECWGEFPSGNLRVWAGGRNAAGKAVSFASAQLSPPAGDRGRIRVTVPTKGMAPLSHFNVRMTDADRRGKSIRLYECVMTRD